MIQAIYITQEDILHQVKLSGKIPQIIEQITQRKINQSIATKVGIKVEIEELQRTADQMRLLNQLTNVEDTWVWLKQHSLSLDDFEEIVYTTLLSSKLANYLFADQVEPYFYENQLNYLGAVMYEVMLDDEDVAWEIFYAIAEGEKSFYDVAHKYNQDVELRRKGGYRGVMRRQDLQPEISAVVFAAKPPQILKPIVTAKGIHLIFVEEIIKTQLDDKQRLEIAADLYYEWLKMQSEEVELNVQLD